MEGFLMSDTSKDVRDHLQQLVSSALHSILLPRQSTTHRAKHEERIDQSRIEEPESFERKVKEDQTKEHRSDNVERQLGDIVVERNEDVIVARGGLVDYTLIRHCGEV